MELERFILVRGSRESWEKRSELWGSTLRSVLFKGLPHRVNEHLHNWHSLTALEWVERKKAAKILDVGCGYGRLTAPLLMNLPDVEVIGFDISLNYVRMYRENTRCLAFAGSVEEIPTHLNLFDSILCVTVLMYLDEEKVDMVISELVSRLKKGGKLILIEPDKSGLIFQTGYGLDKLIKRRTDKSNISTGGHVFRSECLKRAISYAGGLIKSEKRLPATTLSLIPMYIVCKMLPGKEVKWLFTAIAYFDRLLGRTRLPSIYVAYEIYKDSE